MALFSRAMHCKLIWWLNIWFYGSEMTLSPQIGNLNNSAGGIVTSTAIAPLPHSIHTTQPNSVKELNGS